MRRNLVSLLIGGVAGALVMTLLPAAATEATAPATEPEAETTQQEEPPPPFLRSHGVRIEAAQIGYCTREQVESGCFFQDIFIPTRKLPVHPRGHVLVNTRVDATEVSVSLHCGSAGPVWQLGERRWVFHVSRRQGRRASCGGGSINITYGEGTGFDGGLAGYTFSTKPHRH